MDKSVDYFQQAVARAPDYAMAYAGLAAVYTRQASLRASDRIEAVKKARTALTRALDLDPDLAEAHTALGLIRFYFEWDWSGADVAFRRALELNPGSQAVHEEFGNFLNAIGRVDEGLARSGEAARLDPLSPGPAHDIAINAMIRGDYELAAAGFRRTIDIDPNWTWGYVKLARTLALQNDFKEAFAQAEIAERRIAGGAAPLSWSWLGATYATCGDTARARDKLDQLHTLEKTQYVDPVTFAEITARWTKWTRRWSGMKKLSRTGRRTWSTPPSCLDSAVTLRAIGAFRRSSIAWAFLEREDRGGGSTASARGGKRCAGDDLRGWVIQGGRKRHHRCRVGRILGPLAAPNP